ncbi:glutamyl-tRNA reductase [bacterium]|nr:glutamyl-tRNA reductase [bacterium]
MNIIAIGINHRTAPIEVREKFCFSHDENRDALRMLKQKFFDECLIISTCNRTEVYGTYAALCPVNPLPIQQIIEQLIELKSAGEYVRTDHFYILEADRAVSHLFAVASGIDSMVVGDIQITNQIKEACRIAQEEETLGSHLNRLTQQAFHAGKRARFETHISEGAVSVSYTAVNLAEKNFSNLSERTALLIGAGETSKLTAKHLSGKSIGKLLIANRTFSHAQELTQIVGGMAIEMERIESYLPDVDIIISSVDAHHYILTKSQIENAMRIRDQRPLLIIDIGVPRNIDPAVAEIFGISLHDMDALSKTIDANLELRKADIPRIEGIIQEELAEYQKWYLSLNVSPLIHDLHYHFEQVRQDEIGKFANRFGEDDRELVEMITKRIIGKLLHHPTVCLKNGFGEDDGNQYRNLYVVRSLFGLEENIH